MRSSRQLAGIAFHQAMESADPDVFSDPLGEIAQVVVVSHGVVAGGGAVQETVLLNFAEFFFLKLRFPDPAPVFLIGDQIKTGREGAVCADRTGCEIRSIWRSFFSMSVISSSRSSMAMIW